MIGLKRHPLVWRLSIGLALVIAIVGPWAFERINVPAKYPCAAPYVRLQGDFCGLPVSGIGILSAVIPESIRSSLELVSGAMDVADFARKAVVMLGAAFLLLPLISTLLLLFNEGGAGRLLFDWVAWVLAAAVSLGWLFLWEKGVLPGQLWGAWLYVGLAVTMLMMKAVFSGRRKPGLTG